MSTPFYLVLPNHFYLEMLAQAQAEYPNECCGILAGRIVSSPVAAFAKTRGARTREIDQPRVLANAATEIGIVESRYPLINELASPVEFLSEPKSMFAAYRDLTRRGLEVLAIYHSHPTTEPIPSRKDRERNYDPGVMNLIISLKGAEPEVRAWWLTAEDFREGEWEIFL